MNLWRSLAGVLEVELTSAELETALSAVNAQGIELLYMYKTDDLTCQFCIRRKDFDKLQRLSERRGETLRIIRRKGFYWIGKMQLKRPVWLFGFGLLLVMSLFLPTRILFVTVQGNNTVPTRQIIADAEESGVCFGASRREVRSEKVKNGILSDIPQLQWVGVNTSGCTAIISVRERSVPDLVETDNQVTQIVAARDGYILSGTATQGNALFQVGQTVQKGQVLISGYTDCGICIQATRSQGEIIAQTTRNLTAVMPSEYLQRGAVQQVKRKYSLLFRKKRINLWKDSGIPDASCGRMYEEYYVTLPGGFQLPVAVCVEEYHYYDLQAVQLTQFDAESSLSSFAQQYLKQHMVAGEIRERSETIALDDGVYRLNGAYICVEMIGREQQEQIGETNGKNS